MTESIFGAFGAPLEPTPLPRRPEYHQEEAVPGVELNNYVKRVPSEDGTYVLVTEHEERIEKIKQPLTPEEQAAKRKQERIALAVLGGLGVSFFGFLGWVSYLDAKKTIQTGVELVTE